MRRLFFALGVFIFSLIFLFSLFINQLPQSAKKSQSINLTLSDENFQKNLDIIASKVGIKYGYPALLSLKFIILEENETSPPLKSVYEDMTNRQIMMATVEDYYQTMKKLNLNPKNTVFVHKNMALIYMNTTLDPNNLTEEQVIVGKVVYHETEHLKQQMILDNSGLNITLDTLFWQNSQPTPTQRLLEALADSRLNLATTPNYRGEEIEKAINQENTSYARLTKIYNLYKELMEKLDKNGSIEKSKAQSLIQLIRGLNSNPTSEEKKLLQLN